MNRTTDAAFWARVDTTGGMTACWPWTGNRGDGGYGRVFMEGTYEYVHRIALTLHLGRPIAPGMKACHSCDNPPCCNPLHLFEGSAGDNIHDSISKGRWPSGSRNVRAALDASQVALIRAGGERADDLAARFGVNRRTIYRVRAGATYSDESMPS